MTQKDKEEVCFIFTKYSIFIVDVKSRKFMYQRGRAGHEAKERKTPAKSRRVGITVYIKVMECLLEISEKPKL